MFVFAVVIGGSGALDTIMFTFCLLFISKV